MGAVAALREDEASECLSCDYRPAQHANGQAYAADTDCSAVDLAIIAAHQFDKTLLFEQLDVLLYRSQRRFVIQCQIVIGGKATTVDICIIGQF